MSDALRETAAPSEEKPIAVLTLHPIHGSERDAFTVSLEDDLLSLLSPDGRLVMMLPRDEAVRHVRFNYDVLRGRTVSFVVVEGLKAYTFKCPLLELEQLLNWLPQKPRAQQEEEHRRYGVSLVLLGGAMLLLHDFFFRGWASALLLLGVANVLCPRRFLYGVNAAVMSAIAMALFFLPLALGAPPAENAETVRLLSTGLGSLLIIWSVQQLSLMGPIHRLRMARRHHDAEAPGVESVPSRAVKRVAAGLVLLGALFAANLVWAGVRGPAEPGAIPLVYTGLVYAAAVLTTLGAAAALWLRGFRAYLEAKIAGQFAIVLAVFYAAGVAAMLFDPRVPLSPHGLADGLYAFANIQVWVPLVVLVLLFNRWFAGAVERELEQLHR
jgi:hypothetical protein